MSRDKPSHTAPSRICSEEPLPTYKVPTSRWGDPYLGQGRDVWVVNLRRPLTPAQAAFGLQTILTAAQIGDLPPLMKAEDERYLKFCDLNRLAVEVQDDPSR